jgi:hypothetical protein
MMRHIWRISPSSAPASNRSSARDEPQPAARDHVND